MFQVEELIEQFHLQGGESIYPRDLITTNVLNVIASIMFGSRLERADPHLEILVSAVHNFVADTMDLVPINVFPPVRFLPSIQRSIQKVNAFQVGYVQGSGAVAYSPCN